mmetsp:Transcript_44730/g.66386  ORF Transcript_44730/g.66386 Transcript_44730/m.66386 type:complete len:192 (+) Transcript_44730:995-1570(+)
MRRKPYKLSWRWKLVSFVWRKYRGKISETNRSVSRTLKASPLGSHETIEGSSVLSISINFRGKGLECPVDAEEDDEFILPGAELTLELDDVRVILRVCGGCATPDVTGCAAAACNFCSMSPMIGEVPGFPGGVAKEAPILITPAAPLPTGTTLIPAVVMGGSGTDVVAGALLESGPKLDKAPLETLLDSAP